MSITFQFWEHWKLTIQWELRNYRGKPTQTTIITKLIKFNGTLINSITTLRPDLQRVITQSESPKIQRKINKTSHPNVNRIINTAMINSLEALTSQLTLLSPCSMFTRTWMGQSSVPENHHQSVNIMNAFANWIIIIRHVNCKSPKAPQSLVLVTLLFLLSLSKQHPQNIQ